MEQKKLVMISRYQAVFNSDDGKIVLQDMMQHWGILSDIFDENPRIHAFNEGARSVVMRILRTINADLDTIEESMQRQLEKDDDVFEEL